MVRARGVARKSFARRRVRRVKKYDCHVTPLRFKKYLPRMSDLIEPELEDSVGLEQPVEDELTVKGVPQSEWQYYEGFAKRMLSLYRNFTGETLKKEKESLIEEYVLRGKVRDVLEQEQDVVEEYVGIVVSCDQVKACLEGDYSSYAYQWKYAPVNAARGDGYILRVDETNNFIQIITHELYWLLKLNLLTGALISETDVKQYFTAGVSNRSLLQKYIAYVFNNGGVPNLRIEKDGTLLQTIDLSLAPISWASVSTVYHVSISTDGKYISVWNNNAIQYALFKGS